MSYSHAQFDAQFIFADAQFNAQFPVSAWSDNCGKIKNPEAGVPAVAGDANHKREEMTVREWEVGVYEVLSKQ